LHQNKNQDLFLNVDWGSGSRLACLSLKNTHFNYNDVPGTEILLSKASHTNLPGIFPADSYGLIMRPVLEAPFRVSKSVTSKPF